MNNPFANIQEAYDSFFVDSIEVTTKHDGMKYRATITASVFPIEDIEPFADTNVESAVKSVSILIRKCDWIWDFPPTIGDQIYLTDDGFYKVAEVQKEQNWWKILARSNGQKGMVS